MDEKILWGLLPLYEHEIWPSAQGSTLWKSLRFWDFKAESYYIWEKTYTTDVSKRTYLQTRFLWEFRLAWRLNVMGMLENMTICSYISFVCKYSVNCSRCGLCPTYIFSSIDNFTTKTEDILSLFSFSCSLWYMSGSPTYLDQYNGASHSRWHCWWARMCLRQLCLLI